MMKESESTDKSAFAGRGKHALVTLFVNVSKRRLGSHTGTQFRRCRPRLRSTRYSIYFYRRPGTCSPDARTSAVYRQPYRLPSIKFKCHAHILPAATPELHAVFIRQKRSVRPERRAWSLGGHSPEAGQEKLKFLCAECSGQARLFAQE